MGRSDSRTIGQIHEEIPIHADNILIYHMKRQKNAENNPSLKFANGPVIFLQIAIERC